MERDVDIGIPIDGKVVIAIFNITVPTDYMIWFQRVIDL